MLELLQELDRVCKKLNIRYFLFAGTLLGAVRHQGFIPWDDDLDVLMFREDYERFLKEANSVLDGQRFYLQKEFDIHWPMFFSKLRLNGTTCLEPYHPKDPLCHQGVYMDIFPCDRASSTKIGRLMQFCASKVVIAKGLYYRGYETDSRMKRIFMQVCHFLPNKPFLTIVRKGSPKSGLRHTFLGGASKMDRNVYSEELFSTTMDGYFEGHLYPIPVGYEKLLHTMYGDYMRIPTPEERRCKRHAILVELNSPYEEHIADRDGMIFESGTRSIR